MKRLVLHLMTAAAAATAGWYAGSESVPAEVSAKSPRVPAIAGRAAASRAPSWRSQLSAVRAVPGAASESAWVKWAFAIPDADVPAAVAKLNPKSDFHALRCLYARWVKLDPQAAWAHFRRSAIPAKCSRFYLPDRDDGRHGLVYSSLSLEPRSLIGARMLASWMTVDPAAARAFAAKLAVPGSTEAKEMPVSSYEMKRVMDSKTTEDRASETNAAAWSAAAVEALESTDAATRRSALHNALPKWMDEDPAAACQWIQQLPQEHRKLLGFDYLRWSMRNAPAATRVKTLAAMLEDRSLSAEDFARVAAGRSTPYYEFTGDRQGVYNAAESVREWTAQEPAEARKFVESLPENDLKALLGGEAAGVLVRTDINAAVALLNQTGGDQQLALKGMMRGWMETDVPASLAWAGKIEDTATRDACRETVAVSIAGSDPDLALETARTITDPAIRQKIHAAVSGSLSWNPAALEQLRSRYPGDDWKGPPVRSP